jgi:cytochrome bd-type quinol oxidase subunit 2
MRQFLLRGLLIFIISVLGLLALTGNAAAQADAFICFSGIFCLFPVLMLVISIIIAIWVYRDAESRGMNGVLWLIVVLVAGIIGLIVYLVVRTDKPQYPPGGYPPPAYGGYPPPPPGGQYPPPPPPGNY